MSGLRVRDLRIAAGRTPLVRGLDLDVVPGECLAIVGESGTGKSLTAAALLGLLPRTLSWSAAALEVDGVDARGLDERRWRRKKPRRRVGSTYRNTAWSATISE